MLRCGFQEYRQVNGLCDICSVIDLMMMYIQSMLSMSIWYDPGVVRAEHDF